MLLYSKSRTKISFQIYGYFYVYQIDNNEIENQSQNIMVVNSNGIEDRGDQCRIQTKVVGEL